MYPNLEFKIVVFTNLFYHLSFIIFFYVFRQNNQSIRLKFEMQKMVIFFRWILNCKSIPICFILMIKRRQLWHTSMRYKIASNLSTFTQMFVNFFDDPNSKLNLMFSKKNTKIDEIILSKKETWKFLFTFSWEYWKWNYTSFLVTFIWVLKGVWFT